jgi:hypothetical protein
MTLLLQQLLDPPHGFLPAHLLLDGQVFESRCRHHSFALSGRITLHQVAD